VRKKANFGYVLDYVILCILCVYIQMKENEDASDYGCIYTQLFSVSYTDL